MHLYTTVFRVDLRSLFEQLEPSKVITVDDVIFGVITHGTLRIQFAGNRNCFACALQRSRISWWRTVLQALGSPGSSERKVIPSRFEGGVQLGNSFEDRPEIGITKRVVAKS